MDLLPHRALKARMKSSIETSQTRREALTGYKMMITSKMMASAHATQPCRSFERSLQLYATKKENDLRNEMKEKRGIKGLNELMLKAYLVKEVTDKTKTKKTFGNR